jgi:hypothetical protein
MPPTNVQELTITDFPLPTLGPKLEQFRDSVAFGRGFYLLRGNEKVPQPAGCHLIYSTLLPAAAQLKTAEGGRAACLHCCTLVYICRLPQHALCRM